MGCMRAEQEGHGAASNSGFALASHACCCCSTRLKHAQRGDAIVSSSSSPAALGDQVLESISGCWAWMMPARGPSFGRHGDGGVVVWAWTRQHQWTAAKKLGADSKEFNGWEAKEVPGVGAIFTCLAPRWIQGCAAQWGSDREGDIGKAWKLEAQNVRY